MALNYVPVLMQHQFVFIWLLQLMKGHLNKEHNQNVNFIQTRKGDSYQTPGHFSVSDLTAESQCYQPCVSNAPDHDCSGSVNKAILHMQDALITKLTKIFKLYLEF